MIEHDPNKLKNNQSLIGHVIDDLGGVVFAVEAIDKTLAFASKAFKDNKNYQFVVKTLRGMNPVILTGHNIYNSIKYYAEQKKQMYARQRKANVILRLIGFDHLNEFELDYHDFPIGKEIITWFVTKPRTNKFKIIDFYDSNFETASSKNLEKGEYYILVEYENSKYMIEVDSTVMNNQVFVSSCYIHTVNRPEKVKDLKNAIFNEFIQAFDTHNNVIELSIKGLQTRRRMKLDFEVNQFDVQKLKSEIKKSIIKGKKRGYIMVGPPGVGKSTVIVQLESEISNIPIVYVSSSGNIFREDIANTFNFLRSISPCIAIFEDLDAYELSSKQDRIFGEFIEQMDNLKHSECIVVIASLNEPENVHASLINRRGRFDKVYFIDYPKTVEEVISVMKNKYKTETGKVLPFEKLDAQLIAKIVNHNFSHADICEVIDNLLINDISVDVNSIDTSIESVIETMKAVSKCEN